MAAKPEVYCLPHMPTWTCSYVVTDPATKKCAIVDSAVDFNYPSGKVSFEHAEQVIAYVNEHELKVEWILETHAHADHLTAAQYLKRKVGGQIAMGSRITEVQETFAKAFNIEDEVKTDGSQWDKLFDDNEEFKLGEMTVKVMHTPGHTPACVSYYVGDAIFTGDTLFMPDIGTARCDFPGGSVEAMWKSLRRILDLPSATRMFIGHDYPGQRREFRWETSVEEQRKENKMVKDGITEAEYVEARGTRDATLGAPNLLYPSLQVNIRAGEFPAPEREEARYLKIPIQVKL